MTWRLTSRFRSKPRSSEPDGALSGASASAAGADGLRAFAQLAAILSAAPTVAIRLERPDLSCFIGPDAMTHLLAAEWAAHRFDRQDHGLHEKIWICEDTTGHPDYADHPWVLDFPFIRFIAQLRMFDDQGAFMGTVTVLDTERRTLSAKQVLSLQILAQALASQHRVRKVLADQTQVHAVEREFEHRLRQEKMDEAQRLAAELHDGVGQELAGIALMVSGLARVPGAQDEELQRQFADIRNLIIEAMMNCRRVSEGFGGFLVRRDGVTAALRHLASQFHHDNIAVKFDGRDIPGHWLDPTTAYFLFSIGREAIGNAFRHSNASAIRIQCDIFPGRIQLSVEDNGVGLAAAKEEQPGIGRAIMEYRARSIGAQISFMEVPTGGLKVECIVPVPQMSDTEDTKT
jgi:signal transduction histidine kinase